MWLGQAEHLRVRRIEGQAAGADVATRVIGQGHYKRPHEKLEAELVFFFALQQSVADQNICVRMLSWVLEELEESLQFDLSGGAYSDEMGVGLFLGFDATPRTVDPVVDCDDILIGLSGIQCRD